MPSLYRAYRNKVSNKLTGVVHIPYQGSARKGAVLLSYMTSPFTQGLGEYPTDPHTNYWECAEIARLFAIRGYDVDVIDAKNMHFVPRKNYAACVDINTNLERLSPLLGAVCKKVLHITFSYGVFQTAAEKRRLEALFIRRDIRLSSMRPEPVTQSPAYADHLEGFGNTAVHRTYAQFNKPIFPIPISVAKEYPFQEQKDWDASKKHFLWFGGGGALLKGLDLMVEAFAALPEYVLHIVGPAAFESEFETAFAQELSLPNIIRYPRPHLTIDGELLIGSKPFMTLMNQCSSIIYPSASEGTSGAVIQAMHASVIPIMTRETGIADDAPVTLLPAATIKNIQGMAHEIVQSSPEELAARARSSWNYVHTHHTRRTFTVAYTEFIETILKL